MAEKHLDHGQGDAAARGVPRPGNGAACGTDPGPAAGPARLACS